MSPDAEQRLREALDTAAEAVVSPPDAYERTRQVWEHRERRRRRLAIALAVLVIAVADAIGLWALNRADSGSPVVFDGPAPAQVEPGPPRAP